MIGATINVLLADNDLDDCMLFREALSELMLDASLTMVNDGEALMELLINKKVIPDLLFLDLNMPRKNGFECLTAIRQHEDLQLLPIAIYSTSFEPVTVNKLHKQGAKLYIQKPAEFAALKNVIKQAIDTVVLPDAAAQKFIIQPLKMKEGV